MSEAGAQFERLVGVMRTLRSPEGCPWDREQTLQSLTPFVLEEAHEVIDAIERGDMHALKEEIGDHIFEGVFLAQVAADAGSVQCGRLVACGRRQARAAASSRLPGRWPGARCGLEGTGAVGRRGAGSMERLEGARAPGIGAASIDPRRHTEDTAFTPARVQDRQARCELSASTGTLSPMSWPRSRRRSRSCATRSTTILRHIARTEEEMGDLLFAIANLARKLGIEPEAALRKANEKFTRRFTQLERNFTAAGRSLEASTLEEMEKEWQLIKGEEKSKPRRSRRPTDRNTKIHEEHEDPQKHEDPRRTRRSMKTSNHGQSDHDSLKPERR